MAVQSNPAILAHLSHALARISRIPPRTIASPPTQPRRASVAILVRVRPSLEDERFLAQQHERDPEAQQAFQPAASADLSASAATDALGQSGIHVSQASLAPGASEDLSMSAATTADVHAAGSSSSSIGPGSTSSPDLLTTLNGFFSQPWVQRGTPEVLYIKRAARISDKWSAHVAFPGGRREEGDENGLYTAMRETWEEVGIDLAEKEFQCVGQLDDREITTSLGKRLLMVLSPYVFVQTSPFSPLPDLQPSEVASAHWIPLSLLYTPSPKWGTESVDISSRLAPKSPLVRWMLRALVGKMDFKCVLLPNEPVAVAEYDEEEEELARAEAQGYNSRAQHDGQAGAKIAQAEYESPDRPELRLWGLTLGMTLDLLSHMTTYRSDTTLDSRPASTGATTPFVSLPSSPRSAPPPAPGAGAGREALPTTLQTLLSEPLNTTNLNRILTRIRDEFHLNPPPQAHALAPSLSSTFPRFSYPDVNFWIWVFGYRYRSVVRGWTASVGTPAERKANWSGMALGAFYSAVRRALVVAVVLRALGMLSTASVAAWLLGRRINRSRKGLAGFGLDELLA
ncbi:uncharacterized protein PFL1_05049 [Pseudozyma flocculosa PF-1]|uniref:Nudix hydrolase domain-containing protein n=2 Tax=Pseudozyma flocculosa TaxID=84751 RepID=A0A5C3EUQ1_9BASI|nr:uncharacterized protein PFL1_05049 [Pseudozyma flocculosa PF-1]EPQ27511.1 hypothetical protein PFL1_05049 [Pseudozyma flocculosa PF-1]SPO36054.1 uncharacterized protein PSFLO_01525 [Pseudozyma flocculosa]